MATAFDPSSLLGSGRVAEVFAHGANVLKLYKTGQGKKEVFREAGVLAILEDSGLPIPSAVSVRQYGHRWGLELSRAPEGNISTNVEGLATLMGDVHRRIHAVRAQPLTSLKQRLGRNIERAPQLAPEDRDRLLSRLATLPDDDRLCHGDFHPGNVMGGLDSPFVIDWLDAASGPAHADVCRTYLLALHHAPALAKPYLAAYTRASRDLVDQILLWLPIVAAARLSEGVADEVPRLLTLAKANS